MSGALDAVLRNPIGRIAYMPFRGVVRQVRKRIHPDVPLDHAVMNVDSNHRHFAIEVRRWSDSDKMAVDQCFSDQQYDLPGGLHGEYVNEFYCEIVASGRKPLILDCGANIGASVLWFSARYPDAHIVGIEPAPDNFELLQKNCRAADADLIQAGVAAEDGSAWLSDPKGGGMGYRTTEEQTGVEIVMVSLRSVLANKPESKYTPFLLKVDIEGAEKALFSSDHELINRFPLVIMEPHDWMFPGDNTSVEFFRFHSECGREFAMNHENIASMGFPNGWRERLRPTAA